MNNLFLSFLTLQHSSGLSDSGHLEIFTVSVLAQSLLDLAKNSSVGSFHHSLVSGVSRLVLTYNMK